MASVHRAVGPLVRVRFAGSHVPGDPGHRTGALRWRDRESIQRTPWWRGGRHKTALTVE
jgi:hypothetical protein